MRDRSKFGLRVGRAGRLEGNGAGKDSPIDLRQRDMHRQIRRPEPARGGTPGVEPHTREHHLQDRRVERVEDRFLF